MATATAKRGPGRPRKSEEPVAASVVAQEEPTVILPDPIEEEPDEDDTPEGYVEPEITQADLAKAIHALAKGQQAINESQIRKVPYANFKRRSSFNPDGRKNRKLIRRCYQNGYPMNVVVLHNEEIEILNRLKAGRYLNGIVTVRVEEKGVDSTLNIIYKNKSADDKMELKNEFRNLTEFLKRADREGPMED